MHTTGLRDSPCYIGCNQSAVPEGTAATFTLYQTDLKGPVALVLGAEGAGMRQLTAKTCDALVRIPMRCASAQFKELLMNAIKSRATYAMVTRATALFIVAFLAACTQEQQNKISRDIQNWTGTNGVLEVYATNYVFFENPR